MSNFDDALRRDEADRQRLRGEGTAKASQEHQVAEQAASHLNQLLRDFAATLNGRVQPKTVTIRTDIDVKWTRRVSTDVQSVPGYVLAYNKSSIGVPTVVSIVTPDGRLWATRPVLHNSKKTGNSYDRLEGSFVDVTAVNLLAGRITLSSGVRLEDGRAVVSTGWSSWPVEDDLARRANELLGR